MRSFFLPGRLSAMSSHEHSPGASAPANELVLGLEDKPRLLIGLLAALQHLLAIIVPIVTPGLLICQALAFLRVIPT